MVHSTIIQYHLETSPEARPVQTKTSSLMDVKKEVIQTRRCVQSLQDQLVDLTLPEATQTL